ncbi:MAG: hypothetical protein H0V29_08725 [Thermoleophilaceae bacterium]|nr:hypothetical protein [Thermoleophilaceae bacterium]
MAKRDKDLFEKLRKSGVRKKVAGNLADAVGKVDGRKKAPKTAKKALEDFRALVGDLEDRVQGGPEKRKAAAKKGARTRKTKANARSKSAKKGARTRARAK